MDDNDVAQDNNPDLTASLVYDARARERPAGTCHLVQRIYGLLLEHPEGLTLSEIHDHFRDGWLETGAYLAYEKYLKRTRLSYEAFRNASQDNPKPEFQPADVGPDGRLRLFSNDYVYSLNKERWPPVYGTPEFEERAQRWWIQIRLHSMKVARTARREGTTKDTRTKDARWYSGERSPCAIIGWGDSPEGYVHPIDVANAKALAPADTDAHVRRERVKDTLLEALNDKRFKGRGRELAQLAYDNLIEE